MKLGMFRLLSLLVHLTISNLTFDPKWPLLDLVFFILSIFGLDDLENRLVYSPEIWNIGRDRRGCGKLIEIFWVGASPFNPRPATCYIRHNVKSTIFDIFGRNSVSLGFQGYREIWLRQKSHNSVQIQDGCHSNLKTLGLMI